jgi:class 3 adenylate cyclase/predicted ATPase
MMSAVRKWLEAIGVGQYADAFEANDIDMDLLTQVDDQMLKDIGVSSAGHRLRIRNAIAKLIQTSVVEENTSSAGAAPEEPAASAERRQLTVMFCDLAGSTELSARLDPEDLQVIIGAYHRCCTDQVKRNGGFVAKYMGDGVLTYFGYPRAHEHDAERAVRAGLDLVDAVPKLQTAGAFSLQVRVGIATGLVVVGDLIGSGEAQERGIVGETPNLAARLQAIAEPNMVVIADSTRRLLGNLFELKNLGLCELKGLAAPTRAFAVLSPGRIESRFEAMHLAGLRALVGRDEETDLLLRRWERAKSGNGQAVLLCGEPGIGKSRLAAAVLDRIAAEPHFRLRYFCSPHHSDSALYPIIQRMERAAGFEPGDDVQARLDKLDTLLGQISTSAEDKAIFADLLSLPSGERYPKLDLTPQQRRRRTIEAMTRRLEALARQKPVLAVFEDVHWIDPTSLDVLSRMVDRIRKLPVLVIVTFRPEFEPTWAGQSHVALVMLNRLAAADCRAMLEQILGNAKLPDDVVEEIVARTDGVPLFVEELTKAVVEAGTSEAARNQVSMIPSSALTVPATLQASLMARLDRLGSAKEIAQIGAAIGREFSYELIAAVAYRRDAELVNALDRLTDAGLLFREGVPPHATFLFKHALVQDAAYGTLLRQARRKLHAAIAKALTESFSETRESQPEIVAHHYTESGLTEAAVEWWGKAGDRAMRSSAYSEATAHVEKALGLAKELGNSPTNQLLRLRLQLTYGNVLRSARGFGMPETIAAFTVARELASQMQNVPERFSAYYGIWSGRFIRGELIPMRDMAEQFLLDTKSQPQSPEAATAHRVYGMTCWYQGNFAEARKHLEHTLNIYDSKRDREYAFQFGQDIAVAATCYLALSLWSLGEVNRAGLLAEQAVKQAKETQHIPSVAYAHAHQCYFEMVRHDPARASLHAEACLGFGHVHGMPLWIATGTFALGWARCQTAAGDGETTIREGAALVAAQRQATFMPLFVTVQAEVDASAGDLEAGLARLEAQLVTIEQSGQHWFDAEVHRTRGELLLQRSPSDAETAFIRALEIARNQQARTFELRAGTSLARLWRDQGNRAEAHDLLAPIYGWFTEGFDMLDLKEAKALLEQLKT